MNKPFTRKWCCYCKKKLVNRPLGLCWGCHANLEVRTVVKSRRKRGRWDASEVKDFNGGYQEPLPTAAGPGSEQKLQDMEQRALAGVSLFGRMDAGWEANAWADVNVGKTTTYNRGYH